MSSGVSHTLRAVGYEIGLSVQIDCAHRVVGHEGGTGKCARLHGHTYTYDVAVHAPGLDTTGFVVDYAQIKAAINEYDHKTVLWTDDPLLLGVAISGAPGASSVPAFNRGYQDQLGVVRVPFNPTAENLARHMAEKIRALIADDGVQVSVVCRETPKSWARWVAE